MTAAKCECASTGARVVGVGRLSHEGVQEYGIWPSMCVRLCVYVCMSVCIFPELPVHAWSLEKMRKCRNKEPFQTFPGMFESNEPLGTTTSWKDEESQVEGREKGFSEVSNHAWAGSQGSY